MPNKNLSKIFQKLYKGKNENFKRISHWGGAMKRLGRVSHYAKQGFLILRSNWIPALNDRVIDKKLAIVGTVKDVFGPVKAPYIAVKPKIKNPERYVGEILYIDARSDRKNMKKERKGKRRRPAPRKRG